MANDWEKIEQAVFSLLDVAPSEREKWLDEFCAGNIELRAEIESLLAVQSRAQNFLRAPAIPLKPETLQEDPAETDSVGRRIGSFKILREIGRGGMGAVFLAERVEGEFDQQVAVKVIRHAFADAELKRRFKQERQILASLNHSNIARLLDGGVSAEGELFLVMEYVEGESLLEYATHHKLSIEERLQLFLKICSAAAFAHQNLVVHRDIKPSNILVTGEGEPKLLDFGLAKVLDLETDATATQTAFRAMTPAYASPEQIHGKQITTASDVYSLGVVLYELLTGERPFRFEKKSFEEIIRSIDTIEPPKPSDASMQEREKGKKGEREKNTLDNFSSPLLPFSPSQLKGDLDNIVLKALRKEPERRYKSVEAFAEDIERHLKGLPISARPQTFSYRTGKFIRRNKVVMAAAAIVLCSLIGGLAIALWQANVARAERDRAERRFNDVRRLSNSLLFDLSPKIERLQGATEARETLVTQSLKYLDSLAQEAGDDFGLQSELATAYEKVGDIQGNPTNPSRFALKEALASYEKANAIRRKQLGKNPRDFEQRRLLANNYRVLGDILWQTNELAESQKHVEAALNIYNELLAEQTDSPELRIALGQTYHDIGQNLTESEKYAEAISYFQKSINEAETLRRQYPDNIDVLKLLANAHQQIGSAFSWNGQQKEGEAAMAQAIAIYEPLVAANPNDVSLRTGLWQTYWMTSSVYEEQNDYLANEYDFKALRVVEETVAKDPANLRAKEQLAKTYSHLGVTFANIKKPAESIAYLEKAVGMLQEISNNETKNGRFKQNLATALIGLGNARSEQRDFQNAVEDFERAAAILTELAKADSTGSATQRILAVASESLGKTHQALSAQTSGAAKQAHQHAAKINYQRALDILVQLEAKKSLSEYDRKFLERMKAAVEK